MDELEACLSISVVSRMLKVHPQTIRHYEQVGLVRPARSRGNVRLFSLRDVRRLQQIQDYTSRGVNLAGVEIIVNLLEELDRARGGALPRNLADEENPAS